MIYEQPLRAVDPMQLAIDSGASKWPRFSAPIPPVVRPFLLTQNLRGCTCANCGGLAVPPDYGRVRGLGALGACAPNTPYSINALQVPSAGSGNISILQTAAIGANFVPGVGQLASVAITFASQFLNQFEAWLGIGAGRREADIIVPVQNNLMNQLNGITQQITIPNNPSSDTLAALYRQVWTLGVMFQEFVLMCNFTDRRASGQALNTVMPYIDGSCGYAVPVGFTATPSQQNCLTWGDNTVGGPGQTGMLGAIGRALSNQGSGVPVLPDLHQAANTGIHPTALTAGGGGLSTLMSSTIAGIPTPLVLVGAYFLFKGKF